jgi:tetratricopeptide (TPR) repeat protein
MGLFRRLFSAEYRRAISAEAAGDYLDAARGYALCGERGKVAEMHLAQAGIEKTLERRIHSLNTALGFAPEGAPVRRQVLRQLGQSLVERGRTLGLTTAEGRRAMGDGATRLEEARCHERAGDCWMELDDRERAAGAYSKAGLIEKVESILSAQEEQRSRRRQEESSFKDYEFLMQGGQRVAARKALTSCISAAQRKGDYRRLLTELEERLLDGQVTLSVGSATLTLSGSFPLLIGREPDCQLQVRGNTVSRRHAQILRCPGGGFTLEDTGSHNGTLLNGIPIGAPMPLPASGEIGLGGPSCVVAFALGEPPSTRLRLEVKNGLDSGKLLLAGDGRHDLSVILAGGPALSLWFEDGRPLASPRSGLLRLNDARTAGPVELIRDDLVEVDGQRVRIVG